MLTKSLHFFVVGDHFERLVISFFYAEVEKLVSSLSSFAAAESFLC